MDYFTKEETAKLQAVKDSIHKCPELSFKEFETTKKIKNYLDNLGSFNYVDLNLDTGLIAVIKGNLGDGPTIGIRADIDAIEQIEESDVSVRSEIDGLMHGCGHDFHTVAALACAKLFAKNRDFAGTIVFIFQPAEETTQGARYLVEHGLFDRISFDAIIGEHNRPELETGTVAVKKGSLMAAKNNFAIAIDGVGGHGSMPHKCADPIICASAMINSMQSVVSRNIDPMDACVLSIDYINGGNKEHLVVDHVDMQGSLRCLSHESHDRARDRIEHIVRSCAELYECKAKFRYDMDIPLLENSDIMCRIAKKAAQRVVGEACVVTTEASLASEDFAIYSKYAPTFFYWIGSRKPDAPLYSWHNRRFCTDDSAMFIAGEVLYECAVDCLKQEWRSK